MATIKRLTKNKKMNIGKGDNVNDDDNSLIFINNKVNPVTAKMTIAEKVDNHLQAIFCFG